MKAPTSNTRFKVASSLLDYGFTNFEYTKLSSKGEAVQKVEVQKGIEKDVNAVFECDSGTLISKGNNTNIDKIISINENISAPISRGDVIGTVSFSLDNEIISTINLISDTDVNKVNILSMCKHVFRNWFYLFR